jgi:hypothetical protein
MGHIPPKNAFDLKRGMFVSFFPGFVHRGETQLGQEDATADPGDLLQLHSPTDHLHFQPWKRKRKGILQDSLQQVRKKTLEY